jgi:hypothetical protein
MSKKEMGTALLDDLGVAITNLSSFGVQTTEIERAKNALERVFWLAEALREKRSDISETLFGILEGRLPDMGDIESRHITADILMFLPLGAGERISVAYDTLTTLIHYHIHGVHEDDEWIEAENHNYQD